MVPKKKQKSPTHEQVRFITPYNCRSREMKQALAKYWDILLEDKCLKKCLPKTPSLTYKRAQNLRDILVRSHHSGPRPDQAFGSKGPKWGCKPCGTCVACPNVEVTNKFWNSGLTKEYKITHTITCNTKNVVYFAVCPCNLIYVGLTTREFKRRV